MTTDLKKALALSAASGMVLVSSDIEVLCNELCGDPRFDAAFLLYKRANDLERGMLELSELINKGETK